MENGSAFNFVHSITVDLINSRVIESLYTVLYVLDLSMYAVTC